MRKVVWVFAFVLMVGSAVPSAAILHCGDCTCNNPASTPCGGSGGFATCGAFGVCSGCAGCGGGCLTAGEADKFKELIRGLRDTAIAPEERGGAAARLTWRLTQHVEESGLGTVFVGGTSFRLPGRIQTPALAFVHAGAPEGSRPDLVVEFTTSPGHDAAVAGWLSAGVKAVLSVDPLGRTVAVHQAKEVRTLGESDYLELPSVVPGWSLRVGDLFQ